MSVLVFEDDPLLRDLVGLVLKGFGSVRSFASAEEGLEELAQADLLVTDLEMPGMGGLELLRRRDPGTPTVVVSGAPHLLEQVPPDPRLRLVTKPFAADTLRRAATEVLHSRRAC